MCFCTPSIREPFCSNCNLLMFLRIMKLTEQCDELKQQRDELLVAAENLVKVKGRHHAEQAYKQLEAAVAKVKEQK